MATASAPGLLASAWARDLLSRPDVSTVLDASHALVSGDGSIALPPDHFFTALLRAGVVRDMVAAVEQAHDTTPYTFHALAELGDGVCGHPGITHGGVSAALHDDTLGGLAYTLKRDGVAGIPPGPAFTVALEVAYKATVPAGAAVLVSARVDRVDGRKLWLASELRTQPDGVLRNTAKALFVVPKDWEGEKEDGGAGDGGVVSEAGVERLARSPRGDGKA